LQIHESHEVKEGLLHAIITGFSIQNLLCLQYQNTFNITVLNKIEYFHFTFHHVYVYVQIWLGDPWHNDMHGLLLTQEWRMRMQVMEN